MGSNSKQKELRKNYDFYKNCEYLCTFPIWNFASEKSKTEKKACMERMEKGDQLVDCGIKKWIITYRVSSTTCQREFSEFFEKLQTKRKSLILIGIENIIPLNSRLHYLLLTYN